MKRFNEGSGCYSCKVCTRKTRDTGDNGALRLCPECYEMAGIENAIADSGDPDGKLKNEWHALKAACIKKGGVL